VVDSTYSGTFALSSLLLPLPAMQIERVRTVHEVEVLHNGRFVPELRPWARPVLEEARKLRRLLRVIGAMFVILVFEFMERGVLFLKIF
jgi:hypothetical protein